MVPFVINLCSQKLESSCDYWARENPLEGVGTQEASWLHLPGGMHKAKHWVQNYSGQKQLWDSPIQPCTNLILSPPHVERNATDFLYHRQWCQKDFRYICAHVSVICKSHQWFSVAFWMKS